MIGFINQTTAEPADTISWLDITAGLAIPVVVAIMPVVINIVLNARQRHVEREDRLRQAFSEALQAIADYQELPYLVRRRSDVSPMTREELTRYASEVQSRLDFYVARLELESTALGEAFGRLVTATRREAGGQMSQAWTSPRITGDDSVPLGVAYDRTSANEERRRCLSVMRTHVRQRTLRHES